MEIKLTLAVLPDNRLNKDSLKEYTRTVEKRQIVSKLIIKEHLNAL